MAESGERVLRDGTRLGDLIDRERRTFQARIHSDPEIFEIELERIFARSWIPVAHVTEFREPGDFVTRTMGRDPVLVTFDDEGTFRVMLNVCTHRGGEVCPAERGNAPVHRCAFHGWTYEADGTLLGVPFERLIYDGRLARSGLGLWQARVEVAAGMVFACWDAAAPSLDDYLGDFRPYLEAMLCRTEGGIEVEGPPQRFIIDANWKIVSEGFYGDGYHVPSVHQSFVDIGLYQRTDSQVRAFFKASVDGHSVLSQDFEARGLAGDPAELMRMIVPVAMPPSMVDDALAWMPPERARMLTSTPPMIMGLFPSTAVLMIGAGPDATVGAVSSIRFFVPLDPGRTEVLSFSVVERDAPQEFKDALHGVSTSGFGAAGMFEADDAEVWAGVQRGVRGFIGRQMRDDYSATRERSDDPHLPGVDKYRGPSGDDNQWHFYMRYFDVMEGRA